ncbi:MAG TPA: TRIC cation channel family protein, partial [Azospirillaceae bacterium]|nr:TRIC cation channel family protein [Azospirillaceae bacterium]
MIGDGATLTAVLDAVGIFVFGVTGGTLAVRRRFDLFGVVVLAMVTALAGGVARD